MPLTLLTSAARDDGSLANRLTAVGDQPSKKAPGARVSLGLQRFAAAELGLLPTDHPPEAGLKWCDPRTELVAVQG
jgi:hypothetical protein